MAIRLAASNLGWTKEEDEKVYARLKELGYEGLELAPTRIFTQQPYEHLSSAAIFAGYLYQNYGLEIPSLQSIWFGQDGNIFNQEDAARLEEYTAQAFEFARAVRCPSLVFGCPRQRNCPPDHQPQEAEAFFTRLGILAGQKGVYLALEANPPIYNTNYLNTTRQAFDLVKKLDIPGLTVNLDLGTMIQNGESLNDYLGDLKYVSHIHISEPGLAPIQPRPIHRELALLLHAVGYKGFVSLEMKAADYDTLDRCLRYLKEVFG